MVLFPSKEYLEWYLGTLPHGESTVGAKSTYIPCFKKKYVLSRQKISGPGHARALVFLFDRSWSRKSCRGEKCKNI
jgi:hypothetical protein